MTCVKRSSLQDMEGWSYNIGENSTGGVTVSAQCQWLVQGPKGCMVADAKRQCTVYLTSFRQFRKRRAKRFVIRLPALLQKATGLADGAQRHKINEKWVRRWRHRREIVLRCIQCRCALEPVEVEPREQKWHLYISKQPTAQIIVQFDEVPCSLVGIMFGGRTFEFRGLESVNAKMKAKELKRLGLGLG